MYKKKSSGTQKAGRPRPRARARPSAGLLLKAARTLFSQKGYDGASVHQLAAAAGVNVSLVSYHFGGKEGLYKACIEQFGCDKLAVAQGILKPPSTREEFELRLSMFRDEFFRTHIGEPELMRIIHRDFDCCNKMTIDIFYKTFLVAFEKLAGFIEHAQKKGLARKDVDPFDAATMFFGVLIHIMKTEWIRKRRYGLSIKDAVFRDRIGYGVLKVFVDGITAKAGAT